MVTKKKPSLIQRLFKLSDDGEAPVIEDASAGFTPMNRVARGTPGTRSYAGYPSEEYLPLLHGTRRAGIFDQMRRSDGQLTMCLAAVKNPIKSAVWEIEPGAEDGQQPTPEAIADADLVRHILFKDMDRPWKKVLGEILTFPEFGHSVFEVIHKVVLDHPKYGSYNGIEALSFRSQRTIERWNLEIPSGKLKSITQIANGDLYAYVDIEAPFLLVFSLNQEGSNYEGISMLRPCYGSFMRKDEYLKLNAIGIEKGAVGTPMAEVPEGKENSEQFDNLVKVLEQYMSHEQGYITFPKDWKITIDHNAYDPTKVEESVDREDRRMAKAFLCNFLELGMSGGGGAFALSNDLSDFMLSGLELLAEEIEGPINQDLIPALIKMNRGPREFYPRLKHSGISDKAGKELADMLKTLADSKWLTPEDGDENHLRRRIGLPTRTKEGIREVLGQGIRAVVPDGAAAPTLSERIRLAEKTRSGKTGG
jgi:hypothetical protein